MSVRHFRRGLLNTGKMGRFPTASLGVPPPPIVPPVYASATFLTVGGTDTISATTTTSGGTGSYTYSLHPDDTLVDGYSVNASTGAIEGTAATTLMASYVRVRVTSGGLTADSDPFLVAVGPNVILWFEADQINTETDVVDDLVVTWPDVCPANNDATQGTAGSRPTYIASGINSRPSVRSASGKEMGFTTIQAAAGDFTMFAVFSPTATYDAASSFGQLFKSTQVGTAAGGGFIGFGSGTVDQPSEVYSLLYTEGSSPAPRTNISHNGGVKASFPAGTACLVTSKQESLVYAVTADGVDLPLDLPQEVGSPVDQAGLGPLEAGESAMKNADRILGNLAADVSVLIVLSRACTSVEMTAMNNYLQTKYATP